MDKDEIICMAQEAGFSVYDGIVTGGVSDLERFADLVASHEREVCAKVCDEVLGENNVSTAIRERNNHG